MTSPAPHWKIEIARELIALIVPLVEAKAPLTPPSARMPFSTRSADLAGLRVSIAYEVKNLPSALRSVSTLDIWLPNGGGKVCNLQWDPLEVVRLERGAWIRDLLSLTEGRVLQ